MAEKHGTYERDALRIVIEALDPLDQDTRSRILLAAQTFFGLLNGVEFSQQQPKPRDPSFSESKSVSPKEFLRQKQPQTDIERVTCLAYYLTHNRDTHHFKTLDISKLNTEAAQIKFSNAGFAVHNAANAGYLAPAGRGFKQLTSLGEELVSTLPDRVKLKSLTSNTRRRRAKKKSRA